MADPKVLGASKDSSLDDLNTVVAESEGLYGPLTEMGNDDNQSLFSFDQDQDPPDKNAVLASGSSPPNGTKKVCSGDIFIKGTKTSCTAGRPK